MGGQESVWQPGWTEEAPVEGDLLLAFSGNSILKPGDGWFLRWGGPEMGDSRHSATLSSRFWLGLEFVAGVEVSPDPRLDLL